MVCSGPGGDESLYDPGHEGVLLLEKVPLGTPGTRHGGVDSRLHLRPRTLRAYVVRAGMLPRVRWRTQRGAPRSNDELDREMGLIEAQAGLGAVAFIYFNLCVASSFAVVLLQDWMRA